MPVLPAFDAEAVPVAIVEGAGELVEQGAAAVPSAARIGALALGRDALLQHRADDAAGLRPTRDRRWC